MLLAMAEGNTNAVRRLVIVTVAVDRGRGGVVVAGVRNDVELADHVLSDEGLKVAQSILEQGIEGIGKSIVEILLWLYVGKDDIQDSGLGRKLNEPVELHDLEEDTGNHGNRSLAMGEGLSSCVQGHVFINDLGDAAPFIIGAQDGCKPYTFSFNTMDHGLFGHLPLLREGRL